jgi:APA family basic amino acid/polyamine antiporter
LSSSEPIKNTGNLKKRISLFGVIALGAGSAIGVSIFSVISPATALAGPGMLLALSFSILPMILFAVTYAFLGSAVPTSGASYEWPRRFIHPFVGFIIAWLRIAGNTAALIVLAYVLVQYWALVIELPVKLTMFVLLTLFYVLNILGVKLAAKTQSLMLFLLLATCALLVLSAVPKLDVSHFTPFLTKGWTGVFSAVPLMIALFLGIESATEVGEEIINSRKVIPRGITFSLILTALFYFFVSIAVITLIGVEGLSNTEAPLFEAATAGLGSLGTPLILVSASVAIGSSLNSIFLTFSRSILAMGRSGILPEKLSKIHPRFGTPHLATTSVYVFCLFGLLMPSNLVFLFLTVSIPTLLKYGAICIAAVLVVKRHPEIYKKAKFKLRPRLMQAWAYTGAVCAIVIIVLGLSADLRPYLAIGVWGMIGVIYYLIRLKR